MVRAYKNVNFLTFGTIKIKLGTDIKLPKLTKYSNIVQK